MIQKIFSYYPSPQKLSGDGTTGTLFFPSESRENDENATIKVDQEIGKNDSLYVRYVYNWSNSPNAFRSDFLPVDVGAISASGRVQSLAIGLTSTFGSTFTNEIRGGGNRVYGFAGCTGLSTFNGIGLVDPVGNGADYSLPDFSGFGCQALGDSNSQGGGQGTYQLIDVMTKSHGSHTFKWGGEYRDVYANDYSGFSSRADLTFNIYTSSGIPTVQNLNAGVGSNFLEDEVSALLGLVNQQTQTQFFTHTGVRTATDKRNFRQHEFGLFWQDTWKILPNLSLTYGLRWEWYGVPYDALHVMPQGRAFNCDFWFSPISLSQAKSIGCKRKKIHFP